MLLGAAEGRALLMLPEFVVAAVVVVVTLPPLMLVRVLAFFVPLLLLEM